MFAAVSAVVLAGCGDLEQADRVNTFNRCVDESMRPLECVAAVERIYDRKHKEAGK